MDPRSLHDRRPYRRLRSSVLPQTEQPEHNEVLVKIISLFHLLQKVLYQLSVKTVSLDLRELHLLNVHIVGVLEELHHWVGNLMSGTELLGRIQVLH